MFCLHQGRLEKRQRRCQRPHIGVPVRHHRYLPSNVQQATAAFVDLFLIVWASSVYVGKKTNARLIRSGVLPKTIRHHLTRKRASFFLVARFLSVCRTSEFESSESKAWDFFDCPAFFLPSFLAGGSYEACSDETMEYDVTTTWALESTLGSSEVWSGTGRIHDSSHSPEVRLGP